MPRDEARQAAADATAAKARAKARAKALRPWWAKKRTWLGGAVLLVIIIAAATSAGKTAPSGSDSPSGSPSVAFASASYQGAVLSVQAPGAVPAGGTGTPSALSTSTPVLVRWKVTNVGRASGTPSSCAIAIRVPHVSGFGLRVLTVGTLRPGASQTGTSSIAPIGAFPPGRWAGRVGTPDVTVGCK